MSVLGAVLAGGASSRFGSDKALAMWRGRTLLDHARTTLAAVVDEVVLVGRGEVSDLPCAGLGPLGGIAGALDHAARHGFDSVVTIACDMPVVPAALLEALLANAPAYCADMPVLGHWPTAEAGPLLALLCVPAEARTQSGLPPSRENRVGGEFIKTDTLSVRRWALSIGAAAIPSHIPIANINTLADLETL